MNNQDPNIFDVDAAFLREMPLPMPGGEADKESRGRVVVVGGGAGAPGAAILSGLGALRAGAGKLQVAVPRSLAGHVGVAFLEAGVMGYRETAEGEPAALAWTDVRESAARADAVVVGPGIMDEQAAHALAVGLLENVVGPFYVIDAMALCGLNHAAKILAPHEGRVVLTPHAGEMARLTGQSKEHISANPVAVAIETARRLRCLIALKGANTHIATPSGQIFRHRGGVVGLGTAGSGDVLAGILGGLLARGASGLQATAWSVFIHGQAGVRLTERVGPLGFIAREILDEVPRLLAERTPN